MFHWRCLLIASIYIGGTKYISAGQPTQALIKTQQSTDQNYHRKQQRKQFVAHVSKSNTWLENLQSNQIYNEVIPHTRKKPV
jgi:hypothetical protein